MSEIQLHIVINVVSCLNATEGFRSLLVEEVLLHEFLLNQILLLQESLESSLVPHVVEELLGREVVAPPPTFPPSSTPPLPSFKDIPCPLAMGGKVVEECPMVVCTPSPPSVRVSVVVHQPATVQVLVSPSQVLETGRPPLI
jgi:hypothetical protein